ncbi:MAG: N-6 DNA methylase, partial [Acidobacteria bacterium]|nr:N-6 DNA methylase [Acidobacteriota bacterium]
MKAAIDSSPFSIEKEYAAITSIDHRKKFAQFFTPAPIAEMMTQWLLGCSSLKKVLEPAVGLGIFSRELLQKRNNLEIKGFEIDERIFSRAKDVFSSNSNVDLRLADYIFNDWESKYDGIICNPPYFKFHDFDGKPLLAEIEKHTSFRLNGFTNLYALFLLKSLTQLEPNGRAAYIVPSEFLNSDYGKLVKSYLIQNRTLRHVIIFDFEDNVFDDALTTSSVLLFANDEHDEYVRFTNLRTRKDLENVEDLIEHYPIGALHIDAIKYQDLDPNVKWRRYYQTQNEHRYKDLVPFNTYGKVSRGIATGSNDFFIFTKSKADSFDIARQNLLPCICRATDVQSSFFTTANFLDLEMRDRPIFLLNAENGTDSAVEQYLEKGTNEGIDKKYLTASRKPWYSLEKRLPSPIWVSVFHRNGLKFIRNEANIANLTTFHCIYLNMFSAHRADLFFAYLLTDVSSEIFEDNRREYGNGLKKFEPNDINNSKM